MKRLAASLLLSCALIQPALGAWSVTGLGANGNTQTGTVGPSMTTGSVTIPANALGLIGGVARKTAAGDTLAIADSAGNNWTVLPQCASVSGSTTNIAFLAYFRYGGTGLTSGTITATFSANLAAGAAMSASYATGGQLSPVEDTAVRASPGSPNSNSTTPTITSGTPTAPGDLIFGVVARHGTATGFSLTPDAGNGSVALGATGNSNVVEGTWYAINPTTATLTNTPTMNSATWTQCLTGFFVNPPTGTGGNLTTLGVGN